MSNVGPTGYTLLGRWWMRVCILWPIYLTVLGLLITLLEAVLAYFGVGVAIAWIWFYIEIVLIVIIALLMVGGTLFTLGLFITDLFDNFLVNWRKSGVRSAWTTLKTEISSCAKGFLAGARQVGVEFVSGLQAAWKKYGW